MDKTTQFFTDYARSIKASRQTRKNVLDITNILMQNDPLGITKYEVPFRVEAGSLAAKAGFTSIDADSYACKSRQAFLQRLRIYKKIVEDRIDNPALECVFRALTEVANTPMDLYFGTDIEDDVFLFSFWLIFGGADKQGKVDYWPYDFNKITLTILKNLGIKKPIALGKNIFHMSINISNRDLYYELYYELVPFKHDFGDCIKRIKDKFSGYVYHFCSSRVYDKNSRCIGKRLFLYIPRGINTRTRELRSLLEKANGLGSVYFIPKDINRALAVMEGEISLLGIDPGSSITFYVNTLKPFFLADKKARL